MELTANNVQGMVEKCLFDDSTILGGELPPGAVVVDGVVSRFGFDPDHLALASEDILSMLSQLPETFRENEGGGWSFLLACTDADGNQWGEHRDVDNLLCLGISIGAARILLPRELWAVFPGGMPYFSISLAAAKEAQP